MTTDNERDSQTGPLVLNFGTDDAPLCRCGCAEALTGKGQFKVGHDAKLKSYLAATAADGRKLSITHNGTKKLVDPIEWAATRGWAEKITKGAENLRRQRNAATARAATGPAVPRKPKTGEADWETGMNRHRRLVAAARVLLAVGRYTKVSGDRRVEMSDLSDQDLDAIVAGTWPLIVDEIQRHESGLFVGQTVPYKRDGAVRDHEITGFSGDQVRLRLVQVGKAGIEFATAIDELVVAA